jgi:hypothetical protein
MRANRSGGACEDPGVVASSAGWGPVLVGQRVRLKPIDTQLAGAMWAQSQPGVRVITARVDHANVASQRLLNRLGFAYTDADNGMQRFALPSA